MASKRGRDDDRVGDTIELFHLALTHSASPKFEISNLSTSLGSGSALSVDPAIRSQPYFDVKVVQRPAVKPLLTG